MTENGWKTIRESYDVVEADREHDEHPQTCVAWVFVKAHVVPWMVGYRVDVLVQPKTNQVRACVNVPRSVLDRKINCKGEFVDG